MAASIDFTTTDFFKNGIPKPRAFRQSAAIRRPTTRKPADSVKFAVKHYIDGKNPNNFNYAKLQPDEIRLLSIQPGKEQEQINCIMFKAKLKDVANMYEALSYTWGDVPKAHHSIIIDDKNPPAYIPKPEHINLMQDTSRSALSLYRIKRKKRWEQLLFDESETQPAKWKETAKRRKHLEEIDRLRAQRLALDDELMKLEAQDANDNSSNADVPDAVTAAKEDRKRVAIKFSTLDEEYDKMHPIDLEEVRAHQTRLRQRMWDIYSGPPTSRNVTQTNAAFQKFFVRPNLYAALNHLRDPYKPINIWVDAICINQQPDGQKEKDEQLSHMADIYGNALNVAIWLGESDTKSNLALVLIEKMLDFANFDTLLSKLNLNDSMRLDFPNPGRDGYKSNGTNGVDKIENSDSLDEISSEHWYNLMELLRSSWFSRRWIIQEIGMAKNATVHIGDKSMHWDNLSDAITLLNDKADELRSRSGYHDAFDDIEGLSASILVKVISNACRKSSDGTVAIKLMNLEALVCSLLSFDSYYPKDAIYSVLSLAADFPNDYDKNPDNNPDFHIRPNFQRSVRDVLISFVRRSIETTRSLDIICRHWAPVVMNSINQTMLLPSWVSTIDKSPYGRPSSHHGRQYGENFVGFHHGDTRRRYHASLGTTLKFEIARMDQPQIPQKVVDTIPEEPGVVSSAPSNELPNGGLKPDPRSSSITGTTFVNSRIHDPYSAAGESPSPPPPDHPPLDVDRTSGIKEDGTSGPLHISRGGANSVKNDLQAQDRDSRDPNLPSESSASPRNISRQEARDKQLWLQTLKIETKQNNVANDPATPLEARRRTSVVDTKDTLSGILKADGFILCRIGDVSGTMTDTIEGQWVRKLGWKSTEENQNLVPETLWQTLVAGRDANGGVASSLYRRACLHALSDPKITDGHNFIKIAPYTSGSRHLNEYTERYLKRVSNVILKRKFFSGKSDLVNREELYGLAPEEAERGDSICILFGCSVPVILRQISRSEFELVGEAYVYGKMEGEAVTDWKQGNGQTVTFAIL